MKTYNETLIKQTFRLALGLSFILSSSLCLAGVYKWVDEQGNVHYGQQKPIDQSVKKMDVQMHAPRDTSSYKRAGSKNEEGVEGEQDPEAKNKETEEKPKKKPETAAEKKRRLAACAQARKNLATMQSSGQIRSKDKDGNVGYLSDEQKQARIKSTRDLVSKHCK